VREDERGSVVVKSLFDDNPWVDVGSVDGAVEMLPVGNDPVASSQEYGDKVLVAANQKPGAEVAAGDVGAGQHLAGLAESAFQIADRFADQSFAFKNVLLFVHF